MHAHLPFVRHPERPDYLEERWFFEAVTECYLPLIEVFEGLVGDGVDFRLTFSLSPPLLTMFTDPLLQRRYLDYLDTMIRLGESEYQRTAQDAELRSLALFYLGKLKGARRMFAEKYDCNLIQAFSALQALGKLELITCGATHGYLPLMRTKEAMRAQIGTAVDYFTRHFGRPPAGMWLPECGYTSGVDQLLKEFGVHYFFVDTHGLLHADPAPVNGVLAPAACRSGVAVFARDPESSRQVWDRQAGYPGDYDYREFYRDIGYDLELDYLKPFLPSGNIRVDTGFKYYRITGPGPHKEIYRPEAAARRSAEHAANFLFNRRQQVAFHSRHMSLPPVVVAPYDAELFGHWWYEGPQWVDQLCRKIYAEQDTVRMTTPGEYLQKHRELQAVELPMSSWGEGGYSLVWLNPGNDWIYRHLHHAEGRMVDLADLHAGAQGLKRRALNQAARELLLAQSSDWAFIIKVGTVVQYAEKRIREHVYRFNRLADQIEQGNIEEVFLNELEHADNIFPGLDFSIYSRHRQGRYRDYGAGRAHFRILMLSWEYPPGTVGGLARHVYDLSRALIRHGDEVHVITCPVPGEDAYSLQQGVHVHRLAPEQLTAADFLTWVGQMNRGMSALSDRVTEQWGRPDLVHAHDWLVGEAGLQIRDRYGVPLVATIHATEHGRNHGIHTALQRHIHSREAQLTNEAVRVICCSNYMAEEVTGLFGLPDGKVRVIPNGVDPANLLAGRSREPDCADLDTRGGVPTVLFMGRLVPEKGVQVLLESFPAVLSRVPGARLVVAGRGPYQDHLQGRVQELALEGRVSFAGFVDDLGRNRLLEQARVAVFPSLYEPFGIVALEAMAARVPVIVTDTGGLQDIVEHGVDGFKVPPENAGMLGHYTAELLANPLLAQELCQKAWRKIITRYDWYYIATETRDVYREAGER
ncbi:glycosyl transferase family 1 [Desulfotomaculum copahuensis]|uniref:Glycosyl transferase family 1 n=2 Tax=Desulfotomaculum copahuensis TaxID=1838280 RepID=A0A1B7LEY3_9FIRM|nr:glycosyl transferase family 1 [Desulfotomaculum copahuensis]